MHIEEARLRFDMAIGKLPPLSEDQILEHLREFAEEVQEEERLANEQNLITVVSDSISSIVLFSIISQQSRGRQALFNTREPLLLSSAARALLNAARDVPLESALLAVPAPHGSQSPGCSTACRTSLRPS